MAELVLTNPVERMIHPRDVSQPFLSVPLAQGWSDNGRRNGGQARANSMCSLSPGLILQLPQENMQTFSSGE